MGSPSQRTGRRGRFIRRWTGALIALGLLGAGPSTGTPGSDGPRSLILATTTSVRDSGLLDALLPDFTRRTGIRVRLIAVGTGAALRMGRQGDADLLLTHAPEAEQVLVDEGIVRRRTPLMENHFVIAGPPEDPAGVSTAPSPEAAIASIVARGAPWVSRADDSGTHKREQALFRAAGLDPDRRWPGLVRTGAGMGLSLQVAGQRRAYLLSDIGTFLAFRERTGLVALSRPAPGLRNVYSLLQLDASRFARPLHTAEAEALEAYLREPGVLERIGRFGRERFGRALFVPLVVDSPSPSEPAAQRGGAAPR